MLLKPELATILSRAFKLNDAQEWLNHLPESVTLKKEDFLSFLSTLTESCEEWNRHTSRVERALQLSSEEALQRYLRLNEALAELKDKKQQLEKALEDLVQKSQELEKTLEQRDQVMRLFEYARNRFSQLFHEMPIASLTIDSDGLVWEWNKRAVPLFLVPETEALAAPLTAVLGEDCVSEETLDQLKAVVQRMPFEEQEWTTRHHRRLLVNAIPLSGPDEALTGALLTFVDITELRLREKELAEKITELNQAREALERANQRLASLATIDALTGIPNRRALDDQLLAVMSETKRGKTFCLALIDLDHFKNINDEWGHDTGDEVLKKFARILRHSVRRADFIARYGGEEFAVIFPHTPLPQAISICERIRLRAQNISIGNRTLTVSIGVASSDLAPDIKGILKSADDALYQAKRSGRDRVVSAVSPAENAA
ncbi:MAG: diguanylate cyclase [Fimbriimonadales bacterium]|nr:diguanylate cyclase [Fimbriimonadales bacterium]